MPDVQGPASSFTGCRRGLLALALASAVLPASPRPAVGEAPPPAPLVEEDSREPSIFDKAFDLGFLRPFGIVQIAASSAFLVLAYPVALVVGGEDELVRACIRDPIYQTFERPLGRL
jgi:hypothetical protein